MTGAEVPYNRGAQFVAMPGPTGHRIRRLSIFKCARFLKRALKNQTCAEKRPDPSHRHAMMAKRIHMKRLSVFYMHFGQDVIAKADQFTRAFEDYRAEHCLLSG